VLTGGPGGGKTAVQDRLNRIASGPAGLCRLMSPAAFEIPLESAIDLDAVRLIQTL